MKKFFYILTLILFSCKQNYTEIKNKYAYNNLYVDSLSISLPIDSTMKGYYNLFQVKNIYDTCFFICYDDHNQTFSFINLDNNELTSKKVKFEINGPNGVGTISSFDFYSYDSIFIYNGNFLFQMNARGYIINKYELYKKNVENRAFSAAQNRYNIKYFSKTKTIGCLQKKSFIPRKNNDRYNLNSELMIQLNGDTIKNIIEIYSPFSKKYLNDYFGYLDNPFRIYNEDKIIYTYPIDNNIYVFSMTNRKSEIYGGKSKYIKSDISGISKHSSDERKELALFMESPQYFNFLFDSALNVYYRIVFHRMSYKKENGKYNSFKDKRRSIMVFDDSFEIIDEFEIDSYFDPTFNFIGPSGLYLYENSTEDEMIFKVIKIKKDV